MKTPLFKKVVWAVDVFEPREFQQNAQFITGLISREAGAEVYPVHVFSYPFEHAAEMNDFEEAYVALAEKRLKILKKEAGIEGMQDGKVLIDRHSMTRSAVEQLVEFALSIDADVIVASTHSRGTVARLFTGSFAETLLLRSSVPVLTVNPSTKVRERISSVLFPSGLSSKFRPAFEEALEICKFFDASLTVFYKEPFIPILEGSAAYVQFLEDEEERKRNEADFYKVMARQKNVPFKFEYEHEQGVVADGIEKFAANNKFDLILMVSQTSPYKGPRAGSVCRHVVRSAECAVLTMKTAETE